MLKISKGMVVFICFLKDATEAKVEKAVSTVVNIKLSEENEGDKRKSVLACGGDLLIIPQATLGGEAKGNSVQYHSNVDPKDGRELYDKFCKEVKEKFGEVTVPSAVNVHCGIYGARQVLSMETNGPFTHVLDV